MGRWQASRFDPATPLYAQDWHAGTGKYRGVLCTDYDMSAVLANLRTVDDCYDEPFLDEKYAVLGSEYVGQL